jgi:hypothetical protein
VSRGERPPTSRAERSSPPDPRRYALQANRCGHKQRVLLFDGESNPEFKFWGDLWAFSSERGTWAELRIV